MIGYLCGKVLDSSDGKLLLGIGASADSAANSQATPNFLNSSTSMVGYLVTIPQNPAYLKHSRGETVELFIYTHIREDALDLYGFHSTAEKELFLALLSVTGIGPKGAMGVISGSEPERLIHALLSKDKDFLTRIPGVGKKTSERIVLELSDPLRKKIENGGFASLRSKRSNEINSDNGHQAVPTVHGAEIDSNLRLMQDAQAALVGLGYKEQEAVSVLNRVFSEKKAQKQEVAKPEDLVRAALRQLA